MRGDTRFCFDFAISRFTDFRPQKSQQSSLRCCIKHLRLRLTKAGIAVPAFHLCPHADANPRAASSLTQSRSTNQHITETTHITRNKPYQQLTCNRGHIGMLSASFSVTYIFTAGEGTSHSSAFSASVVAGGAYENARVSRVFCSSSWAFAEPVAGLALAERFTERTDLGVASLRSRGSVNHIAPMLAGSS